MICKECGAIFTPYKSNQRFCTPAHNSQYRQKQYRQRTQVKHAEALQASTELDTLKEQNVALQNENDNLKSEVERLKTERIDRDDYLKGIINRYKEIADKREEEIDRLEGTITTQKKEIERLKLERRVIDKTNTNKTQHFAREHLERVLTSEIKRQFPNNAIVQEHIGAIRAFNASYINALVTA